MPRNVKSTMLDQLLSIVAPHLCASCGDFGAILCEGCIYDIIEQHEQRCIACGATSSDGLCKQCAAHLPYSRAWYGGERREALERTIDMYKFERVRAATAPLAEVLLSVLPVIPADVTVVPIPTISPHIRRRGYDHALLLAQYIATKRGLKVSLAVRRATNAQQHGSSRVQRLAQAKRAYKVTGECSGRYLLVDDIVTTGASLYYTAKALREAGAEDVWVAVVARQPSPTGENLLQ